MKQINRIEAGLAFLVFYSLLLPSSTTWAGPTLPAEYTKAGAVDCDKFTEPTVTVEGDEVSYAFNYDPKYARTCGTANAAALLWASGYHGIKDQNGNSKNAANLREYFEWMCGDYADYLGVGKDPYPWMGLGQQKSYMDKYLKDPKTNSNDTSKPRDTVDIHANVEDKKNVPLTQEQVEELKKQLVACSLVSLIIQKDGQNHEVQMVGWNTDGSFKIFDPDTDRAVWDKDAQTYRFEDIEHWGSSLADNKWRLTPEGSTDAWDVVAYKKFSHVPAPGALGLVLTGLGLVRPPRRHS